jgi:hypothetical protein
VSQGLMVYLVPRDEFLAAPGSGDSTLITDICEQFAEDLEQFDRDFETDNPDVWDGPSARGAVAELIDGDPSADEDAGLYTAAFGLVCQHFGKMVLNDYFSPCRAEWLGHLDTIMAAGGVPLPLGNLWCIAPPVRPPWDRLLEFGHWPADAMQAAAAPLDRLLPSIADPEERGALNTVRG